MVARKCPNCGIIRYSANTKDWVCEQCGNVVSAKDEISIRGDEDDGYRKRVSE